MLKSITSNQFFFLLIITTMPLSTKDTHKEFIKKKAALVAEMAKLVRKEKEATEKEKEVACNMEAAWLAA